MFRMFFFLHHRWWSDFPDSDLSASWKLKIYKLLFSKCRVDKIIEEWTIESFRAKSFSTEPNHTYKTIAPNCEKEFIKSRKN